MKIIQIGALVLALIVLPVSNAQAQGTSIAVIDIQQMMTESEAAKSVREQVQSYQEKFLGELREKEEALREKEKEVVSQRNNLSQEEFNKKREEFETQLIEARQYAQSRKRSLEEASAKALGKLKEEVLKVVQAIVDERGFDLILAKQHVILGAKTIDISEESMKRLNAAIKDIKVTITEK